jgi:hypothetical protein
MFALPIGGKRILLASYDLSKPFAAEYWSKLSNSERDLALNAELAMELDAERLKRLGYEVISVSSPFPRIPANGHIFYPTMLNALILEGVAGSRQLLLPSYEGYETDIQSAALNQIAAAFGPKTEIVTIEATEAAKAQGGVHCLTLTAPFALSIFSDSADATRRTECVARKEQLDRNLATEIASQIPATGLQGSWAILEEEEQSEETPLEIYPQRIFFGDHEFQKGVFDRVESKGTYSIDTKDRATWSLHFLFADQDVTPAVVQWLSKDEVKLVLKDSDRALLLRRIGTDKVSPFKPEEPASPQTGEGAGSPSRKHPASKKPATSTGQSSGTAQPPQS